MAPSLRASHVAVYTDLVDFDINHRFGFDGETNSFFSKAIRASAKGFLMESQRVFLHSDAW